MKILIAVCIALGGLIIVALLKIASEPNPLCNGVCDKCDVEKECEHSFMR